MVELVIIGILLGAFALIAWHRIEWGVLLVVFFLPTYLIRFTIGPLPTTVLEWMILIVFFIFAAKKKIWRILSLRYFHRMRSMAGFFWITIVLFLITATASIAVSPNTMAALGVWRAYFIEPFLFFVVLINSIRDTPHFVRLFCVALLSGLSIALVAFFQKMTGIGIPAPWLVERRVTSVFPYPNAVGLYCAPLIPLAFALLMAYWERLRGWQRGLATGGFILWTSSVGVAIVFAKTEAAYIAVIAGCACVMALWTRRMRMIVFFTGIVVGVALFVSPPLFSAVKEKVLLKDWSGRVRLITWKETIPMLSDHWLMGAGLSGYKEKMEPYHKARAIEIFQYPHSLFLNFWSEIGIFGAISFFLLLIGNFLLLSCVYIYEGRKGLTIDRALAVGCIGAFVAVCVHGLVDVPYFKNDLSVFFWLLTGVAYTLYGKQKNPNLLS